MSPKQTILLAIRNHERRTEMAVADAVMDLPADLPLDLKTCLYRLVQEGLNNAFRHAAGAETKVCANTNGQKLTVTVMDRGPGFDCAVSGSNSGLGLVGLRDRIEANDGTLEIFTRPGMGTHLIATFELKLQGQF